MEKLFIQGGRRLSGTVKVSGAKNAVLPVIAASLLASTPSVIEEIPDLDDVKTITEVLQYLGLTTRWQEPGSLFIDSTGVKSCEASYELVRKMRASFLVMGPLLSRFQEARISLPGGCAIGSRPIDLHLKGFEALGAEIILGHGFIEARAPHGLPARRPDPART